MGETGGIVKREEKNTQVLVWVGKHKGCTTLNRAWGKQEDNIEMDNLPFWRSTLGQQPTRTAEQRLEVTNDRC
jgi:hypothetical protein